MFGKRRNEIEPPPIGVEPNAVEVLRVWAVPGQPQQLALQTTWKDPAAWGLLLADIARHSSRAYANNGASEQETFARILQAFQAEIQAPTDLGSQ
jgi:hypothetical protein